MTPQERDLVLGLTQRLKQTAPQQPKDAEAEALVKRELAGMPDAAYYLIQTVLIQEMALQQAQNRINEMERAGPQTQAQQRSFLGGSVPAAGPWGRQPPQQAGRPGMPGAGGWGGQPQGMQPMMQPSATSGFLRNAAMTAAGVAGGALLFHGITSMLGGGLGGGHGSPSATEASSQGQAWSPAEQPQEQLAGNEDPAAQDVAYDDPGAGFDDSDLA